jgi:hypothetical protein
MAVVLESYKYKSGDRRAFHRAQGDAQVAARRRPIWVLHAHEGNLDNRAPFFHKETQCVGYPASPGP